MERIYRDKSDQSILHDEMTVIDHALTRPWTADKRYVLEPDPRPDWFEFYCTESNSQIIIGKENYFLSGWHADARQERPSAARLKIF